MEKAYIGIGAGFGDEGKGNITDILCSRNPSTINIRFNGGSQAAHTVVTPEGRKHAFHHLGAGTFTGAPTYLGKEFLVNPFTFDKERRSLETEFGIVSTVYVNPECNVTTLWDMYINQAVETMRGKERHGSCGLGINETVHRSKYEEYRITVMDLVSPERLYKKLNKIQNDYVPMRLKYKYHISLNDLPEKYKALITNEENINMTMFYSFEFTKNVQIMGDYILNKYDTGVFEGAQGLMLDQGYERFWPNVTTSNTGIKNVMKILNNINFKGDIEIHYISRCYATRHGRGLFPTEVKGLPYKRIVDRTNVPNEFQESLRFGILDTDLLIEAINRDLQDLNLPAKIFPTFTCFDQLQDDKSAKFKLEDEEGEVSKEQFLFEMHNIFSKNIINFSGIYATKGCTRNDLIENPGL